MPAYESFCFGFVWCLGWGCYDTAGWQALLVPWLHTLTISGHTWQEVGDSKSLQCFAGDLSLAARAHLTASAASLKCWGLHTLPRPPQLTTYWCINIWLPRLSRRMLLSPWCLPQDEAPLAWHGNLLDDTLFTGCLPFPQITPLKCCLHSPNELPPTSQSWGLLQGEGN